VILRAVIAVAILLGASLLSSRTIRAGEVPVAREDLSALPTTIAGWQGRPAPPLADDVLAQLGVDDYVNRTYVKEGGAPIGLYVGYYTSQRQGDTIHSPQNCLPGAGWHPVSSGIREIHTGGRTVRVNEYIIEKGISRQVVLYWYHGRGRIVANEYANKAWLMFDAARLHRSNGGLVRVLAPVSLATEDTSRDAAAFAEALFPFLDKFLP
jgi:EpsI family protein